MKKKATFLLMLFIIVLSSFHVSSLITANTSGTNVLITEVLYDTPGDDSVEEWIELYNPTNNPINIEGWQIQDNAGSFTLSGTISAGGFLVLARDANGFYNLYGFYPDIIIGSSLALSNRGDELLLVDSSGLEVDFVAWEGYVSGWDISAYHTTIYRISAIDTDTVSDWADSGNLGTPGSGDYDSETSDSTPPSVIITGPVDEAIVYGTITIYADASDENGISAYDVMVDNTVVGHSLPYEWNTNNVEDGIHTITVKATDPSGNTGQDSITITINNSNPPLPPSGPYKVMEYNIEESGANSDWKSVVKEENPDIAVFIETGTWDDNNDQLMKQYLDEFNSYFKEEPPYQGVVTQNIAYSTSGEAIFSRYPIINFTQIPLVTLDNGSQFDVSHDFLDVVVNITGNLVHVIAAHLKCCSGETNEYKRERAQEGIINYMDGLGNVPIMYLGDLNSFSPEDTGSLAPNGDLGYGPMSMLLKNDDFGTYSIYGSSIHNFTDVFRTLNPTEPGYTYGHTNPTYESRIDFIVVNQFFNGLLINSTVGDTPSADTGSDHYDVDVFLQPFGADTIPPGKVTGLSGNAVSGTQIDLYWDNNPENDLDHYNVYKDGIFIASTTVNNFSDTGLNSETSYTYQVSAVDKSGNEGLLSDPVTITTPDVTPPSKVVGVQITSVTTTTISLSWQQAPEEDVDHYNVYRDGVFIASTATTSFKDTNLSPSTTYTYEISAVDTSENEGLKSDPISGTTASEEINHLIITEVYYDTKGTDAKYEWIEIFNPTEQIISLDGWAVKDGNEGIFYLSGVINPGEYLVIAKNFDGFTSKYGFTPDFAGFTFSLSNRGDLVKLIDNNGNIIDMVAWENYVSGWGITARTGQTIGRILLNTDTDSVNDWGVYSNEGTPKQQN